ncbi:MAG: hypothetical protein GY719_11265 [bacterium]|nr:hypothetical protein [bacterium]
MPAELSIILNRLKKEAASVAGSGRSNSPLVTETLSQRVVTPEGQSPPDFMALQLGLVWLVETELAQVETYDEALVEDLDEDRKHLLERIAEADEVYDVLSAIQDASQGVYGKEARLELFGQVDTLPRDPRLMVTVGKRVRRRLDDPEYSFPAPRLRGWALSERQELATDLGGKVNRLDGTVAALEDERKDSDNSRFIKVGAVENFRRTIRFTAGCLASLYGLAGLDDLAAKIRPKRRRRRNAGGNGDEEAEATAADVPTNGDEGATSEEPTGPTLVVS